MNKKSSENTNITNILAEGISIIGVVFTTLLSILITVVCSISDYTQIFGLIDAVQHESAFTVIVSSVTICIFLNFSMYVAGTVIKRMVSGKPLGGSMAISAICTALAFMLFFAVFALSFRFKYALRDTLFSIDPAGSVDAVINKAVKAGSEAVSSTLGRQVSTTEIIQISAIMSGLMPAFTSVLSLLSVLLLYDPLASEAAAKRLKVIYYKYRYYKTNKELTDLDSDLLQYEQLPTLYGELLTKDYNLYTQFCSETIDSELTAKTAEYTAAIELFKDDQYAVTRLSSELADIQIKDRPQPQLDKTDNVELPKTILDHISAAGELFDRVRSVRDAPPDKPVSSADDTDNTEESDFSCSQTLPVSPVINTRNNGSDEEACDTDTTDDGDDGVPSFKTINIPDSMVSPQLSQAVVNQ